MKSVAFAFAALIALGVPAYAAEGKDAPKHACHSIDELKASLPSAKFTTLNAGQFHIVEGAYVVLPPPSGLPNADGGVLVQVKDKPSFIIWTKGIKPVCIADLNPMQIADKFIAIIKSIKPGPAEAADPAEDHSGELSL